MNTKLTNLFIKLVKVTSPSGKEELFVQYIKKWLKEMNLHYQTDKLGNTLAKKNGIGEPFLFCVHMDTVNPGKGIKPVIKNGIIKSSGDTVLGGDNKAALACLLIAVEKYLKTCKQPRAFELLFTVKEETGGGVEFFPFEWIKSKKALVFDFAKPLGGIVLRSPYIINFHAQFIGKASHSSMPEQGKNALKTVIQALNNIQLGKLDNGETTINVGLIQGGTGINIVPGKVNISGEIRSYSKELFDKKLKEINSIFAESAKKNKLTFIFKTDGYCPGYEHDPKSSFIKDVKKLLLKINLKPKLYYYSGVSDANILNYKGLKTVNVCDGVKNPHTLNEQIRIGGLKKLEEIIYSFLLSY